MIPIIDSTDKFEFIIRDNSGSAPDTYITYDGNGGIEISRMDLRTRIILIGLDK